MRGKAFKPDIGAFCGSPHVPTAASPGGYKGARPAPPPHLAQVEPPGGSMLTGIGPSTRKNSGSSPTRGECTGSARSLAVPFRHPRDRVFDKSKVR